MLRNALPAVVLCATCAAMFGQEPPASECRIWRRHEYQVSHPQLPGRMAYDAKRGVAVYAGLGETWEWDGETWTLRESEQLPAVREHTVAYDDHRGVTVLYGGYTVNSQGTRVYSGSTWEWDGNTWSLRSESGPPAIAYASMAFDSSRAVSVLFAGDLSNDIAETWEWDGMDWQLQTAVGPGPRDAATVVYDPARKATLLIGGTEEDTTLWQWDGKAWSIADSNMPATLYQPSAAFDESRNRLVVLDTISGNVHEWDGQQWDAFRIPVLFEQGGYMSCPLIYDTEHQVLIGAYIANSYGQGFSACTLMDRGFGWEVPASTGPLGRYVQAMVFDSSAGETLMFGGRPHGTGYLNESWIWNGSRWSLLLQPGPSRRQAPAVAFDRHRRVAVLFGGNGPSGSPVAHCCALGDTWEWDGNEWHWRSDEGPAARLGAAIAFDELRGETLLFGGLELSSDSDSTLLGDTWVWNGQQWIQLPVSGPSKRSGSSMTYDRGRGVIVLFGGLADEPLDPKRSVDGQTWEWNGKTWDLVTETGPSPRSGHRMFYDDVRDRVMLFGGFDVNTQLLADSWEWDGIDWTFQGTRVPAILQGAAAYDESRKQAVYLAGPTGPRSTDAGETWLYVQSKLGDVDGDCDVDLLDVAAHQLCTSGHGDHVPCERLDVKGPAGLDLHDWSDMAATFTGPTSGAK